MGQQVSSPRCLLQPFPLAFPRLIFCICRCSRAALEFFNTPQAGFQVSQLESLVARSAPTEKLQNWKALNAQLHSSVQVGGAHASVLRPYRSLVSCSFPRALQVANQDMSLTIGGTEPIPGFLELPPSAGAARLVLKVAYRPVLGLLEGGSQRSAVLVQVLIWGLSCIASPSELPLRVGVIEKGVLLHALASQVVQQSTTDMEDINLVGLKPCAARMSFANTGLSPVRMPCSLLVAYG